MLVLTPPVPGPIVRPFAYAGSPFAAGLHRGVDFRAAPGAVVIAPCSGRVAWAGAAGVTLVCAGRRVTLLPLDRVRVKAGASVPAGAPVARAAPGAGHAAVAPGARGGGGALLHLGVRRAGDPFGYVDPERFLRRPGSAAPPMLGPGRRRRLSPPAPAQPAPVDAPALRPAPARPAAPAVAPVPSRGGLAPWSAWVGVTFLLAAVVRRRRIRLRRAACISAATSARSGFGA